MVGGNNGGPISALGATPDTTSRSVDTTSSPDLKTLPTQATRNERDSSPSLLTTEITSSPNSRPALDRISRATSSPSRAASVTSSASDAISTDSESLL